MPDLYTLAPTTSIGYTTPPVANATLGMHSESVCQLPTPQHAGVSLARRHKTFDPSQTSASAPPFCGNAPVGSSRLAMVFAGLSSSDQCALSLTAIIPALKQRGTYGHLLAGLLENADVTRSGVLTKAQWDWYCRGLAYASNVLDGIEDAARGQVESCQAGISTAVALTTHQEAAAPTVNEPQSFAPPSSQADAGTPDKARETWSTVIETEWARRMEIESRKAAPPNMCSAPKAVPEPGCDGKYLDRAFPPSDASIGNPKKDRTFIDADARAATKWIRVPDVIRLNEGLPPHSPVELWQNVSPEALTQGQLGNCWLIAAIAALAEFPSVLRSLFVEADVESGRYVLRLFSMNTARWELVVIDDYVPCIYQEDKSNIPHTVDENLDRLYAWADLHNEDGSRKVPKKWIPHFARPNNREMWPLLLEKAMAKFVGTYAGIAGGFEPYALIAFTGMPLAYVFARPSMDDEGTSSKLGSWQWCGAQYSSREKVGMYYLPVAGDVPALADDQMWSWLQMYGARRYMMTVSIVKFQRPEQRRGYYRRDGLVLGHAYSLLNFVSARVSVGGNVQETIEWIDLDGDCIGFERVGDCVFSVCNGNRWQPSGVRNTVHIVTLSVSEKDQQFEACDSMNTYYTGFCPRDKCGAVSQLWQNSRAYKMPQVCQEPSVLEVGARVRFHNLTSKRTDLNGRIGEVLGLAPDPEFYRVRLVIDLQVGVTTLAEADTYGVKLVKRQNLQVVPGVPGSRGGFVRLVQLRNPHGEGELTMDGNHSTKWKGDWSDNSKLWVAHPEVAAQVGCRSMNDGKFWMSWEDFRNVFDRVCVLPKSMAPPSSDVFEMGQMKSRKRCLSLAKMVQMQEKSSTLLQDLDAACVEFDPFDLLPAFLEDGSLDTRLRWEASKPGRLHAFLEMNKGNPSGQKALEDRVHVLGLGGALGVNGHI